ncbi:hypothetical protein SELMODRAFT_121644 [Selaginella moellendorffii]|uniref:Zinc finger CCCH-type with G patch domain-containing protein n=1 Tax=Selaginella moellendorffii TaxID=88036 RepID=D8SPD0_SELML|nr:zinc finger CCCH domain-containing protein 18 [Selaginella moellendorffii]EFJ13763.1 hypothetical protein SELMODRAFT_121644 [Selaginella moellendorffii]|eukprot:XP_002985269.1 zinc finger CCCH domain-containing protein 18 [Selaginella moellendorffii]
MGVEEEEESALLERELEEQLIEHNESLPALEEALLREPGNQELQSLREDLVAAVKEVEESLLSLKRRRLLLQIDSSKDLLACDKDEEQQQQRQREQHFVAGSKCRFRHTDGRWYNGRVLDLCQDGTNARVSFLTPTNEKMQICRFFLQQRCRYGESCRSSHGFLVQLSSLKDLPDVRWQEIEIGSTVLACSSTDGTGLWRDAEVEKLVDQLQVVNVVFSDDGSKAIVGKENLALSEHAAVTDPSSTSSSSSDESSDDEEILPGIGTFSGYQQTETVLFANWEKHTRGVASKLMAKMGYKQGSGLGTSGQGLVTPLQVRVLPPKTSLDYVSESTPPKPSAKKKSRGGKRKRDRKFAEARRASKALEEAEEAPDVFSFINVQLSSSSRMDSSAKEKKPAVAATGKSKEDRRSLVRQQDEIKELASKVAKLEEMARRNRKEKSVFEAVTRKLGEARKALGDAEAALQSTAHAVRSKEEEKKWLRF